MGRPRTASNVLAMKGAFRHDPARGRAREGEMEANGPVGDAPEFLQPDERGCWDYMKGLLPDGALGRTDRVTLEIGSILLAHVRRVGIDGVNPAKLARLTAILGTMGMSPADRSKVKLFPGAPANPFLADE